MTQQQHPSTPPPELVREWQREANHNEPMFPQVAAKAAEWGADQVAAYRSLCIRLLNALDSGNAKAEEHVLCQIRQAINEETP